MKILVLNGSPKGIRSNTLKLTQAFLQGFNEKEPNQTDILDISKLSIGHCLGCFNCWTKTPGKCVIKDDMEDILEKYLQADLIIWSFPLYYFGMPSKIKGVLDRMLPLNLPLMEELSDGSCGHPSRYDLSGKRFMLISTCGFYTIENNYDALFKQFDILYGKEELTSIICPEGELFGVPQLKVRTEEYLEHVKNAGREYAGGAILDDTQKYLKELLYPPKAFIQMADASWHIQEGEDIDKSHIKENAIPLKPKESSYYFMKQMSAIYNTNSYSGKDVVIELFFTDLNKAYQLCLKKDGCSLKTEDFSKYTTRIETSFRVWLDISEGKLDGAQALFEHKYKVLGDFDTMLKMDEYFGTKKPEVLKVGKRDKKSNMSFLLMPWMVIWILMAINPLWGGIGGIVVSASIPLAASRNKVTIYDNISVFLVAILSLLAVLGVPAKFVVTLSYFLFGMMWLLSCQTNIPLTAHYSMNDYNGEEALKNPLFMKTNQILTLCWGVLYILTSLWSYLLMGTTVAYLTGLINSICPFLLGMFTVWFQRWYPARYARG